MLNYRSGARFYFDVYNIRGKHPLSMYVDNCGYFNVYHIILGIEFLFENNRT